jgi:predicted transcriptional regulator of viral defense system
LSGGYEARQDVHNIAFQGGILTVDEVREVEGFDPLSVRNSKGR